MRGGVTLSVDFDALQENLSVEACLSSYPKERYQFTWPGKREAKLEARRPINKTLKPCPEKSVNWDTTENIYIEGDNLEALKIMRETYMHKVKMIYIDPPYNTGHDFVYKDNFAQSKEEYLNEDGSYDEEGNRLEENLESNGRFHSDWCSMMYSRLLLARDFLTDDGVIFISIDDNEQSNLRRLCDEVFGSDNYRNTILVRRRVKSLNLQFADSGLKSFNVGSEYILVYSRTDKFMFKPIEKKKKKIPKKGTWNVFWSNADRPTMRYELLGFTPKTGQWRWRKELADLAVENYDTYLKEFSSSMSLEEYWIQTGCLKKFVRRIDNGKGKNGGVQYWVGPKSTELRTSNWLDLEVTQIAKEFDLPFNNPKNIALMEELIKCINGNDFAVMDFFSGSATMAHAVMNVNSLDGGCRKYICIQLAESLEDKTIEDSAGYNNICEIGEERIRRAGSIIKEEVNEANKAPKLGEELKKVPDVGFRVFEVAESNIKDKSLSPDEIHQMNFEELNADNLKEGAANLDLLYEVLPKFRIDYSADVETEILCDKEVFVVNGNQLVACFDVDITNGVIQAIAEIQPLYAVFRDASFANEAARTNLEEIFKAFSPDTQLRVI